MRFFLAVAIGNILVVKDGTTTDKVDMLPDHFYYRECNIDEHVFRVRLNEQPVDPYYVLGFCLVRLVNYYLKGK